MSAANFSRINAKNFYIYDSRSYYDPETEDWTDEWREGCEVHYMDPEDIEEDIRNFGIDCHGFQDVPAYPASRWEGYICMKRRNIRVAGVSVVLEGGITYQPGYYDNGTLDWDISDDLTRSAITDYYRNDRADYAREIADYAMCEAGWGEGLQKMNRERVARRVLREIEALGEELDKFCAKACTDPCQGATFSNGEGIYWAIPAAA